MIESRSLPHNQGSQPRGGKQEAKLHLRTTVDAQDTSLVCLHKCDRHKTTTADTRQVGVSKAIAMRGNDGR